MNIQTPGRRGGRAVGGPVPGHYNGPMTRSCPKCEARPAWRCYRLVDERQVPMKGFHQERVTPRGPRQARS